MTICVSVSGPEDAAPVIAPCLHQHLLLQNPRLSLGEIAQKANAKRLVATHFGSYDTSNPVVREIMGVHMPKELIGPALLDEVAADIKETYSGELRLAHDNMRIDI